MFFSCKPTMFASSEIVDVPVSISMQGMLNLLFIPSHVAVDFLICGAVLTTEEDTAYKAMKLEIEPENETAATLFTETCFGRVPYGILVFPGDVITLKVKRIVFNPAAIAPRMFYASWDVDIDKEEKERRPVK